MSPPLLEKEKVFLIIIIFLSLFLYTWKIGDIVFIDEDAALYAQIGWDMLQRGDWFTPCYNFEPFFDKQPLVFWLNAISFMIFGKSEFSARIWHSLMATGGVFILYLIAGELFDRKTALLSSLIFSTFIFYFYQSRCPLLDIPLNLFISSGLYFFILFLKYKKLLYNYLFWISLGLAFMTKGFVGLVLPLMITAVFLFVKRKKELIKDFKKYFLHISLGFMAFFLIAGPWHFIEYCLHGNIFIEKVFIKLTFLRFFKGDGEVAPSHPFFTHFVTILLGCLPWSGFLPCGLFLMFRDKDRWGRKYFILLWIFLIFLFFSLSAPKRIRYILPLFPALGIIAGHLWAKYLTSPEELIKKYMTISAILSLPVSLLIFAALFFAKIKFPLEYERMSPFCLPPLLFLAFGIMVSVAVLLLHRRKAAFLCFVFVSLFTYTSLIWFSCSYFNENRPIKIFSGIINENIKDGEETGSFLSFCPSLIFYTDHKVQYINSEKELSEFLGKPHRVFCMAEEKDLNIAGFEKYHGRPIFILKEKAGYLLISNREQ